MEPSQFFQDSLAKSAVELRRIKSQLRANSLIRLLLFCAAAVAVYFLWNISAYVAGIILVFIATFLILVRRHSDFKEKLKVETSFHLLCAEELEILNGHWRDRFDGAAFSTADHAYASDLNIFGTHSIYQYLNRSKTELAQSRLATWLKTEITTPELISREQKIISELSADPEFLLRIMAHASHTEMSAKSLEAVKNWSETRPFLRRSGSWFVLRWLIPAFALASTVLVALGMISFQVYLLSLIVPGIPLILNLKKHQSEFSKLSKLVSDADQFDAMLRLIRDAPFGVGVEGLRASANLEESREGLRRLKKIVGAVDSRNNIAVAVVLNFLLMWDFQCAKRIFEWKETYASFLAGWLELVSTVETYAGFGLYVYSHPWYQYAILTKEPSFEMIAARHILMPEDAVSNSLELSGQRHFSIITGANMAGKSTYLRTVGTNLILAMRGLPVPVASLAFRPSPLFTSMLSADSLGDNESYFFNELKRLRQMSDRLEAGEFHFVILDEILKGTNSVDKAHGSRRFMEKLLRLPAKGIIATHDLSLCELADAHPEEVQNNKFEVRFENGELAFDYKLERGICQNMNASFLLKKMGLSD